MLHLDAAETEQEAVYQVFHTRMKRAVALLQALLAYYRVKKVPPIATKERIEIEDAALAVATGELCLGDVPLRLDSLRYDRTPEGEPLTDEDGFPAARGCAQRIPVHETGRRPASPADRPRG